MSKFLITGRQGCGKTTIIKLLDHNGFTAYNTDDIKEVTKLQNRRTGEVVDWPQGKVDWSVYAWNWQKPAIDRLLASDEIVFLGGVVSNQIDFYPLFDKRFVLIVSADNLEKRLRNHEHPSHHLPGEIERILRNHEPNQRAFVDEGCIPVDANRPAIEVVHEILQIAGIDRSLVDFS